jgi:hypothetical protein
MGYDSTQEVVQVYKCGCAAFYHDSVESAPLPYYSLSSQQQHHDDELLVVGPRLITQSPFRQHNIIPANPVFLSCYSKDSSVP